MGQSSLSSRAAAASPGRRGGIVRRRSLKQWLQDLLRDTIGIPVSNHFELLLGGPVHFQTVRTACQLGLFTLLRKRPGLSAAEIAQELHLQEEPARILLMSCVALKVLKKRGLRYRCHPIFAKLLDGQDPECLVPAFEWMHHVVYLSMFHYAESIRECRAAGLEVFAGQEDNLYERLSHAPEIKAVFYATMRARGRLTNPRLADRLDFSKFRRVLDVGGGNGDTLAAIAVRHPSVEGTLFDYPQVAEMANCEFQRQGLGARLRGVAGNIFEDSFPPQHDCVMFCHFTPIFSQEMNRRLVSRAFAALEPGGMVCIYAPFSRDDETGPMRAALMSPYFLCTVNGQGRLYSWRESTFWLQDAGFENMIQVELFSGEGALLGFKPGGDTRA